MRYFIGKDARQLGPFDAQHVRDQLDAGAYSYEDLVWREGLPGWAPLRTEFPPLTATPHFLPPGVTAAASPIQPAPTSAAAPSAPPRPIAGGNTGFVLGLVNILTWFIPVIGLPLSIWGLVASIKARNRGAGGKALAGIILNSIALLLTLLNAAVGAYLGATGQHPLLN